MFSLKLDHAKPAKAKDPKDLQVRRQVRAARRHPWQGDRAHSPICTTSACPACCMAAWCARRRSAPSSKASTRARSRTCPASSRSCARAISSASWRESEWAAIKAANKLKATWSKWEGLPEQAKLYEHVRATKSVAGPGHEQRRRYRGRDGRPTACAKTCRRPTTSPSTSTARSARPARSPSSRTASSPRGRLRRRRTTCASSSPNVRVAGR